MYLCRLGLGSARGEKGGGAVTREGLAYVPNSKFQEPGAGTMMGGLRTTQFTVMPLGN